MVKRFSTRSSLRLALERSQSDAIVERIVEPAKPLGPGLDDQLGEIRALVVPVARAHHQAMLAEFDRLLVPVDRHMADIQNGLLRLQNSRLRFHIRQRKSSWGGAARYSRPTRRSARAWLCKFRAEATKTWPEFQRLCKMFCARWALADVSTAGDSEGDIKACWLRNERRGRARLPSQIGRRGAIASTG